VHEDLGVLRVQASRHVEGGQRLLDLASVEAAASPPMVRLGTMRAQLDGFRERRLGLVPLLLVEVRLAQRQRRCQAAGCRLSASRVPGAACSLPSFFVPPPAVSVTGLCCWSKTARPPPAASNKPAAPITRRRDRRDEPPLLRRSAASLPASWYRSLGVRARHF